MTTDIRPYGSGQGLGYYWIRQASSAGRFTSQNLALVAIDEVGNVTDTGSRRADDEAAMTQEEAVLVHLAPGIKQADADLARRRKEGAASEPAQPKPQPMDKATRDFLEYD